MNLIEIKKPTAEECFRGAVIAERWIKCPHKEKKCKWNMGENFKKGYEYLNNSCYKSGPLTELDCPE